MNLTTMTVAALIARRSHLQAALTNPATRDRALAMLAAVASELAARSTR